MWTTVRLLCLNQNYNQKYVWKRSIINTGTISTLINSSVKLHPKAIYSSKNVPSYSIVYCHCYARNSIQYLVDLKAKNYLHQLSTTLLNLNPCGKWTMFLMVQGLDWLSHPFKFFNFALGYIDSVYWSIVMLKEFTSSINQCQVAHFQSIIYSLLS